MYPKLRLESAPARLGGQIAEHLCAQAARSLMACRYAWFEGDAAWPCWVFFEYAMPGSAVGLIITPHPTP